MHDSFDTSVACGAGLQNERDCCLFWKVGKRSQEYEMRKIRLKYIIYAILILLFAVIIIFVILFQRNIRTAASVRKLEDGLYSMEYKGDYGLDLFLEQGGAADDLAVAEFVIQDVFHGLFPVDLRGTSFGCSTISARTSEGEAVFGRNFDWGTCTALIVQTRPAKGYASVSTVNMDFLNLGLRIPEETQMRLLSVAAPFAPMDGINEKGLCVAVLMIQDSPGFQQDTGKPDLTTTTAVRLLLDQAADVEEAVELLSQYDMHASAGMMVHFALADATGHSVVVEYIDNEMVVTETEVVTNYYISPGEKYGIGTEESKIRYAMLKDLLQSSSSFDMDGIRDALDSVSKHNFDSEFASTEWSIVYNQSTGEARYYHRENYQKYYSFIAGSP